MKHLRSEFVSSPDLLKCIVQYRIGTDQYTATGYVIDILPNQVVLYDSSAFHTIGGDHQTITHVAPSHSGLDLSYHTRSFYNISPDSLTTLLYTHPVTTLETSSNYPFMGTVNGRTTTGTTLKATYINSFSIAPAIDTTSTTFYPDPRIHAHYRQLALLQQLAAKQDQAQIDAQNALEHLRIQAQTETDFIRKESLINQINAHRPPKTRDYQLDIDRLRIQIAQLEKIDHIKHEKHQASGRLDSAHYSGFYTYITITPQADP